MTTDSDLLAFARCQSASLSAFNRSQTATYGTPRMPFRDIEPLTDAEDLIAAAQHSTNGGPLTEEMSERVCQAYLDILAQADALTRQIKILQDYGDFAYRTLQTERTLHEATRKARVQFAQQSADWERLYVAERTSHAETIAQMTAGLRDSIAAVLVADGETCEAESERDDVTEQLCEANRRLREMAVEHRTLIAAMKRIADGGAA